MSVAAIDCGTSTLRLLVLADDGRVLRRESRIVRLGEGVDASGHLAPAALERAFTALDAYAGMLAGLDVRAVRCCATSAVRDSADREAFAVGVRARVGTDPEVLTGAQEAALTYAGAVRGLRADVGAPLLVVDVGGGSTELALGAPGDPAPSAAHSMDVGAVRLTERHLHGDPPGPDEVAAATADVDAALDGAVAAGVDLAAVATVVGVAGTALTLAAGLTGARELAAVDQAVLAPADVTRLVGELTAMPTAARVATGWVDPGRADVLPAGGLVLSRVLARTGAARFVASVADVLDGIGYSLLTAPAAPAPPIPYSPEHHDERYDE